MGSAAAVELVVVTAAASSVDFLDFRVFLGRSVTFDAGTVTLGAGLVALRCGAMKFSARRTASLRPNGGDSRPNGAQTLGDSVGVNRDAFGTAPCGRGRP